jgi:hypothetical protein
MDCPAYVLENTLQSEKRIHNKSEYRSRIGIYLGRSPFHGRNVALVLDRTTDLVRLDPSFKTVKEDKFNQLWQKKGGLRADRKETKVSKNTSKESIFIKRPATEPKGASCLPMKKHKPDDPQEDGEPPSTLQREGKMLQQQPDDTHSRQQRFASPTHPTRPANGVGQTDSKPSDMLSSEDPPESQQVDSRQVPNPARANTTALKTMVKVMEAELSKATVGGIEGELCSFQAMFPACAGFPEQNPIQAYKTTADPDTMYHRQAMKQHDAEEFRKAMKKEWDDQMRNRNFTLIHQWKVPEGATILPSVWQMRRKRDNKTRQIKKYKARLNIDDFKNEAGSTL